MRVGTGSEKLVLGGGAFFGGGGFHGLGRFHVELQWFGGGFAGGIHGVELFDPGLGTGQYGAAGLDQADATLIGGQRVVQAELAAFQG